MTEPRDDAFDGIDGPRPLSPELRDRLVASIVAAAGPLAGIDAPRSLPDTTRQRVESALARKITPRRDLRVRIAAAIAVMVLLVGVAAAATRREHNTSSAAVRGTPIERLATTTTSTPPSGTVGVLGASEPVVVKLDFKSSCGELLDYLKTNGLERVTALGFPPGNRGLAMRPTVRGGLVAGGTGGAAGTGTAAGTGADQSAAASTTNNQEQGVDEPDMVQNDGRFIYVLTAGFKLNIVDAGSTPPLLVSSVTLPQPSNEMFLAGDRLLVLGPYVVDDPETGMGHAKTALTTVDISDPTTPSVADAIELDGSFVSARLVDGLARVVTSSWPTVPYEWPVDGSPEAANAALATNRASVQNSTIKQWIGDRPCSTVGLPNEFSGFDVTSVYTVDPHALSSSHSASVVAGGEMVYASTSNLYVTSMKWDAWQATDAGVVPTDTHTQVHRFDITGRGAPTYIASGQVNGYALNQYALSEQDGDLRIATTNRPQWLAAGAGATSESGVTVLRLIDGELREVGHVGGLGSGETIQGVRFVGDIGFVVTFRRTDPLYVVDLRDPTRPVVRGALEATGFSAYLHPIEPGFLVGVGPSADETGRTTGAQVSVYDMRDLDQPTLVNRVEFPDSYSSVESDPHAFLYWAPRSLMVIPLSASDASGKQDAMIMVVNTSGVAGVGRVSHPNDPTCQCVSAVDRSLVIGDTLYTVSAYAYAGIQATNLDTLADEGWVPFS